MAEPCRRCRIGELALLAGLVVVLVGIIWPLSRPKMRGKLSEPVPDGKRMMLALDRYRADFGAYPPDEVASVGGSAENGASEALVHRLGRELWQYGRARGPYMEFSKGRLTDEDRDGFQEYRDPWGAVYLYARRDDWPHGGAPRGYDLASPGPDGVLGGEMVPGKGYVPATSPEGKAAEADNVVNW